MKEYRDLWIAVLHRAVMDALGFNIDMFSSSPQARRAFIKRAKEYFSLRNRDFLEVCELASLCPKKLVRKLKFVFDNEQTVDFAWLSGFKKKRDASVRRHEERRKKSFRRLPPLAA